MKRFCGGCRKEEVEALKRMIYSIKTSEWKAVNIAVSTEQAIQWVMSERSSEQN